MSMLFIAALMVSAETPATNRIIDQQDWPAIVAAARKTDVPSNILYRALTAPVAKVRRPHETRLCIRHNDIVPGKDGMVCRTRNQWASLGIDITVPKG